MATIYYDRDADPSVLESRPIAIVGYGSQGHAHALNLHDSGFDVRVGLKEGSASWDKVEAAGLRVLETGKAVAEAEVVMMLVPDQFAKEVYDTSIAP
ncbi:MAG: NAD(P)-binding domain-containing protein, partial [Actinomycetota bacterium]